MTEFQFFIAAALSTSIPLIATTIGGVFAERARITNIGMEGLMLVASFASLAVTAALNNVWAGLLAGILAAMLFAGLLAFMIFQFKCNFIIAGIGLNLLASGLTWMLLELVYNEPGAYAPFGIESLPAVRWEFLRSIPLIGEPLYGQNILLWVTFLLIIVAYIVMRFTQYGYWVRAVGQNEEAARAAGINPVLIKVSTLLISGFTAGIAGAFLSTSSIVVFAINMTAGRGFIALGATIFGGGTVLGSVFAAFLFGMAEAASVRFQTQNIPVQIVLMLPYLATILALTINSITQKLRARVDSSYETFVPSITIQD